VVIGWLKVPPVCRWVSGDGRYSSGFFDSEINKWVIFGGKILCTLPFVELKMPN